MARPTSAVTRERADLYATRAAIIEILQYLRLSDAHVIDNIRAHAVRNQVKPIDADVIIGDGHVRESLELILSAAEGK